MKNRFLYLLVLTFIITVACNDQVKHKTAKEIYTSGNVDNIEDFKLIAEYDSFLEIFQYNYDPNLILLKVYTVYTFEDKRTFRNYGFYYKGKLEGKVIFYDKEGKYLGEVFYENGKKVK